MGLIYLGLIAATLIHLVTPQNVTSSIKPKRTLSDQIYTHGETKPMVLLWDQVSNPQQRQVGNDLQAASSTDLRSFAKPLALVSVQQPIQVFEQDTPKPIAAQQVLYEFQQTPTNAFSNVHVKQLFEPTDISTESSLDPSAHSTNFGGSFSQSNDQARSGFSPNSNNFNQHNNGFNQQPALYHNHKNYPMASGYISSPAVSESIAAPVQHNLFTNHGQNTASFNYFNPTHPQTSQTQHISNNNHRPNNNVGKYLYFNGKIVYQPNQAGQFSHNHNKQQQPNLALVQNQQKQNLPMINFLNRHYPQFNEAHHASASGARAKLTPPINAPPASYNYFKPPSPEQYQTINKPILTSNSKKKKVEPEQVDDEQGEEEENNDEEKSESQREDDEEAEENDDENTESNDEESEDDDKISSYEQDFEHDHDTDQEDDDDDNDYEKQYQETKLKAKLKRFEKAENEDDNDHDDNSRRASKQHVTYNKKDKHRHKKPKEKSPKKFETSENYGYKEKYQTSSKYRSPKKGDKEIKHGKPKNYYKKVKYNKKEKPRLEVQEEESKIIPIVHKQKIYKERWYTIDKDNKRNGRDE